MIRQYNAQRFSPEIITTANKARAIRAGTIKVGSIYYIQDGVSPMRGMSRFATVTRRTPWIVEAWHPREIGAAAKVGGKYVNRFAAGGHLATVRSLRDGRRRVVADWLLRWHDDAGLEKE